MWILWSTGGGFKGAVGMTPGSLTKERTEDRPVIDRMLEKSSFLFLLFFFPSLLIHSSSQYLLPKFIICCSVATDEASLVVAPDSSP
jgi:hypothetical protein